MIKTIIITSCVILGLYLLHRLCLWLESNGWIYYVNKKAESGALGNTLQELNAFLNPSVRHTIEMKQNQVVVYRRSEADAPGEPRDTNNHLIGKDAIMNLNNVFIQNITNLYSNEGRAWLDNLPIAIKTLQSRWNLSSITPVDNMTYHYVAKAIFNTNQAVVLKIGYDKKSITDEMRALRYFNGGGAINLIEYDEEYNALLLQQAVPGITLKSLYPSQVDTVIDHYVEAMQALHSKPLKTHANYPHIYDWLIALDKAAPDKFPPQVLTKAIQIKNTLLKTANTQLFLHGDLHLDNILQNGSQWIAIDPKGVIGDPEFEIFAFDFIQSTELVNQSNIHSLLDSRTELIAKKSHLNAQRIKEWAFVRLVLSAAWSIEDNCDPSWAINLATILATQSR